MTPQQQQQQQLKASVVKWFMIFWLNFVVLIFLGVTIGSPVLADKRREMLADLLALNVGLWVPSPLALQGVFKSTVTGDGSDSNE